MFPGIILPFKKKSMTKKLFIKTEPCEEINNLPDKNIVKNNNFECSKPSLKKNIWAEYIKQEKPERIKIEDSENRKFFKSKIIHYDTPIR